ncbi:MAG: pirin family protein [Paracoccaceae bacterium]|nr:pirin family protein [Paracoccaceae bacterium]
MQREIVKVIKGVETSDGAGVSLTRYIGSPQLDMLDPFLLLDFFSSSDPDDYIAGFPEHPHRGFETVTYMLAGRMRHRDHMGNEGVIGPGDVQWMTAGRGVLHSETPEQQDGLLQGFQLWVNLPAHQKMTAPAWRDYKAEDIPLEKTEHSEIRVIAGTTDSGKTGPVAGIATGPLFLDVRLNGQISQRIPEGHNAFVYVIEGHVNDVPAGHLGVFGPGDQAVLRGVDAHFLLIAAQRLDEPVSRAGPFVMNTREELLQAFDDYRAGRIAGGA